jgi:hypothetical protein
MNCLDAVEKEKETDLEKQEMDFKKQEMDFKNLEGDLKLAQFAHYCFLRFKNSRTLSISMWPSNADYRDFHGRLSPNSKFGESKVVELHDSGRHLVNPDSVMGAHTKRWHYSLFDTIYTTSDYYMVAFFSHLWDHSLNSSTAINTPSTWLIILVKTLRKSLIHSSPLVA